MGRRLVLRKKISEKQNKNSFEEFRKKVNEQRKDPKNPFYGKHYLEECNKKYGIDCLCLFQESTGDG